LAQTLEPGQHEWKLTRSREAKTERLKQKNAGLKAVTLIATLNPVSQVLW